MTDREAMKMALELLKQLSSDLWMGNRPDKVDRTILALEVALAQPETQHRQLKRRLVGTYKDVVNHPPHYTAHPSGVDCIQITEHMGFCLGNAIKYIWRADLKDNAIEDLKKAVWYVNKEIERREKNSAL